MSGHIVYGIVASGCQFLALATYLVFLFVAMTAVRSRRPDAWSPFAAAAGLLVFEAIIRMVTSFAMKVETGAFRDKVNSYYALIISMTVLTTVLSIFAWILIMIGLVKIASPPREFSPNRAPGG